MDAFLHKARLSVLAVECEMNGARTRVPASFPRPPAVATERKRLVLWPSSTASRWPPIGLLWSHGLATRAAQEVSGKGDCELSSDGRDRVFDVSFGSDRRRLGVWDAGIGETFRAAGRQRGESPLVRG